MQENPVVRIALLTHHGGTYLTEAYSVSPSGTDNGEPYGNGSCPVFGSKAFGIMLADGYVEAVIVGTHGVVSEPCVFMHEGVDV